ncbi:MAG: hypothetical protein U9R38_06315 [Candidatus Margulisiibacteriota bacterium]|nr:hypothetical protein [Candidatus Margulisiibacteriota bacterium]
MKIIVWDVDDILNNLMYCWFTRKWLPEHPDCKLTYEQITENTPERLLNCTREEYLASLDDFRLSEMYPEMKPNNEVLAWFEKYGDRARHIALTAVPIEAAHVSAAWVMKNYGKWIRSFNFVPSTRRDKTIPEYDNTKAEYIKRLGTVDIFIEDNEENIKGVKEKSLLVSRPWNKGKDSMQQVLDKITKMIKEG